ncbi:MAG: Atu1372/SO_1960 family protein [Acidimicrobiales bacterium]
MTATGMAKSGRVRARLAELGMALPGPHPPHHPLDAVVVHRGVARTSGQLPRVDGELTCVGTLGSTVSVEEGRAAAAICALNALSVLEGALGTLDRVERVLTVTGFVASAPDFHLQPAVVDGASAVLFDIFGEAGRHSRSAVGVAALPRGGAVEVEVEVAVGGAAPGTGTAEDLSRAGAATVGECGARSLPPRVHAIWPGAELCGPAFPVRCTPGDNLAIHVAVARAPAGSVLVVDVGDVPERGYFGEVLTRAAQARGISGLVIDGGVRDIAALERRGFPVFASRVALPGAEKRARGTAGGPAVVAGVQVALGDWVVGDADGVVIVPGDAIDEVVSASRGRAERERGYFDSLRSGATTVELLGLDGAAVEVPVEVDAS